MMQVAEIRTVSRAWVEQHALSTPGFRAAHLGGSANLLPGDAPFPWYRDVDVYIVVADTLPIPHQLELSYRGLILECTYLSADRYRSAAAVLADPLLACHVQRWGILADPMGLLERLHQQVAPEYHQPHWVRARCAVSKARVARAFAASEQLLPSNWTWAIEPYWLAFHHLAGLVALACVRPPTMRAGLVLCRELLREHGLRALYEQILSALGLADLGRGAVVAQLKRATAAFDMATCVPPAASLLGHKFLPHVRPYLVEASHAMIDEGNHREAMWWVGLWALSAHGLLIGAAAPADRPAAEAMRSEFLGGLGLCSATDAARRLEMARAAAQRVAEAAEVITTRWTTE